MEELEYKYQNLKTIIGKLGTLIVAFSGGIDSGLLLKVANDLLEDRVLAVTADSPSIPRRELEQAKRFAKKIGARHLIIQTDETKNRNYLINPFNRCYFCKSELYSKLLDVAMSKKIQFIANGTNLNDLQDYRPGLQAAEEYHIVSPLKDSRLNKRDIRALAKTLNLEIWDKPASPCLSSRVPYGQKITLRKLDMIEKAENYLKDLGIKELRVRHFGSKAGIEVNKGSLETIQKHFPSIDNKFTEIGFEEIEIRELRSGSLNVFLSLNSRFKAKGFRV
jgi:uncharacterized protein